MSAAVFRLQTAGPLNAVTSWNAGLAEARLLAPAPLTFDITRSRAAFDALEADWNALYGRAARGEQMFLQFNWLWHWANHYLGNDRLVIVTARQGDRLVLVLPLVAERTAHLTQLAFMGAPVSQYGDILVDRVADQDALIEGAWAHLRMNERFDVMRLAKVRDDAVIAPKLATLGFTVTATEEAPYVRLTDCKTFDQLELRSSPKHRKNRRRQLRRLEERGPLEIKVHSGTAQSRDVVRQTMTLKRAWLNDKALVSKAFKDERIDAFFSDAVASTARPCGATVSMLSTNGEGGDANVGITSKGRRAVHILAYSLKFDKYGVGNHHLETELKRALADGVEVYDFMAPKHAYKMEWADGTVFVRDHTLAISPLGRLYVDLYVSRLREAMKRNVARLPASWRRWFAGKHSTVA